MYPSSGKHCWTSQQWHPATWRHLKLYQIKPDGKRLDVELIRPNEWLEDAGAVEGGQIELDLAELGAAGSFEITSIGPCPRIQQGRGHVVTGTFAHDPSADLVDVYVQGEPEPIGCTDNHPFWSEDRQTYVEAGDLQPGELVDTEVIGLAEVVKVEPHPQDDRVYNLEVHGEHVYRVGVVGVLVHNKYLAEGKLPTRRQALRLQKERLGIPKSQQPKRSWTIHDPKKVKGPGVRNANPRHQGRVYEYEVPSAGGGTKNVYVVDHANDVFHGGTGHVHTAKPPAGLDYIPPGGRYNEIGELIPYTR